jgi:hypothetical protein
MSNRVFPDTTQPVVAAGRSQSLNAIGVEKPALPGIEPERYVFLFYDDEIPQIRATMDRWLADPELSFDEADVKEVDEQLKAIDRTT